MKHREPLDARDAHGYMTRQPNAINCVYATLLHPHHRIGARKPYIQHREPSMKHHARLDARNAHEYNAIHLGTEGRGVGSR